MGKRSDVASGDLEPDVTVDHESGNRVFFSVAHTLNLGNYESLRVAVGESRTVGPGEDASVIKAKLIKKVIDEMPDITEYVKQELT